MSSEDKCVRVWWHDDVPEPYRSVIADWDDLDWEAVVPPEMKGQYISWMETGTPFGCCDVQVYQAPDGCEVHVGHHS